MRLPHGTKPEAYGAVTGAAMNTMGLGYGPAIGRMAMGAKMANPAQMNIGVWQGGPNKYGPEGAAKSLDHMGSGANHQQYAWGRYDAEAKRVAEDYQKGGNIYKHDLPDADVERYMDFNAPLSKQPQKVQDAWNKFKNSKRGRKFAEEEGHNLETGMHGGEVTGEDIMAMIGDGVTPSKAYEAFFKDIREGRKPSAPLNHAELYLRRNGVPGLKYLDADSVFKSDIDDLIAHRSVKQKIVDKLSEDPSSKVKLAEQKAKIAELDKKIKAKGGATRNFVTWDQDVLNRMKLLERNGEEF
jgi:hypothetical protein